MNETGKDRESKNSMNHGIHNHDSGHVHAEEPLAARGLMFGIGLNLVIVAAELVAGYLAGSLGLLSDAAHNFTDVGALALAWFGMAQARRPATPSRTFGYHRMPILTAQINAVVMVFVSALIFFEAYHRLLAPRPVGGGLVITVAALALAVNMVTVLILQMRGSRDINIRSAVLHLLGDAAASVGIIVSGTVIVLTAWYPIDPIISIILGLAIIWAAWQIIKETLEIFLEQAPRAIDVDRLIEEMRREDGVLDIHDLHVWTIGSELYALSAHVLVDDVKVSESSRILKDLKHMLLSNFGIVHATLEVEAVPCRELGPYCEIKRA